MAVRSLLGKGSRRTFAQLEGWDELLTISLTTSPAHLSSPVKASRRNFSSCCLLRSGFCFALSTEGRLKFVLSARASSAAKSSCEYGILVTGSVKSFELRI